MALKLPDFASLPQDDPRAVDGTPAFPQDDPGAAGLAALGKGAQTAGGAAVDYAATKSRLEQANATTDLFNRLTPLNSQIALETDPEKIAQLRQQYDTAFQTSAGAIGDPDARALWMERHARAISQANADADKHVTMLQRNLGLAGAMRNMDLAAHTGAASDDPQAFENAKLTIQNNIDWLQKGGYAEPTQAYAIQKKLESDLVTGRIDSLTAKGRIDEARALLGQYRDDLGAVTAATLEQKLKTKGDAALGDDMLRRAAGAPTGTADAGGGGPDQVDNWETQNNNFGGLRKVGVPAAGPNAGGFQSFATPEDGVAAISSQLDRYASGATTGTPLTTLRQIVSTWAPPNENDTGALIARASKIVGADPDQPLDLGNPAVKAKLIEATIRNEQGGKLPVNPTVIAKVAGAPAKGGAAAAVNENTDPALNGEINAAPNAGETPLDGPAPDQMVGAGTIPPPAKPPGMQDLANAEAELARQHAQTITALENDPRAPSNPAALAHALQKADVTFRSRQMAITAQKQSITEARNAAADGYVQRMMKGEVSPDLVQQVAADPYLDTQTRENLWRVYEAHTKQAADGDAAKYGPKFFDYYQRVTAPDGDPNKIRDPSQVYALAVPKADGSQDLTLAGVDKLRQELQASSSPERVGDTKMREGALAYAKHQLSFEADYGTFKIPDPKGQDAFNIGFLPAFFGYYEKGITAGKSPTELLSREKLDTLIAPFKRSPADLARDRLSAGTDAGAAQQSAASGPPPAAVSYLQAHPELRDAFDQKYGAGTAAKMLSGAPAPSPDLTPLGRP